MRTRSSKGSLSALGITLVALLALGAFFGSASASAATQHWYGYAGGTKLAEETPTEVVAEGWNVSFQLRYAGVELDINCGQMSADGEIENPSGGGGGTLSGVVFTLNECLVHRPAGKGCTVPSTLKTTALNGEATKFEGTPAIKYEPMSGTQITTFTITGGSECPGLVQGTKTLTGNFIAGYQGVGGQYGITHLSTGLKYGGQTVGLSTDFDLYSKSGKAVALVTDIPAGEHWYLGGLPAEGSKTILAEGTSVGSWSSSGSMSTTISATVAGVKFKMQCSGPSSAMGGSVENPVGGGAGTAYGTMTFGGCSVVEPAGKVCTVEGGGASSKSLVGLATESGGLPAVTLSPAEKTTIVTVTIGGASCPLALKGSKSLTGSLTGVPDPFGIYTFSGNEGLKYAGQVATLTGQATLETSTGERLGIAP